jgi:hypothetical protein
MVLLTFTAVVFGSISYGVIYIINSSEGYTKFYDRDQLVPLEQEIHESILNQHTLEKANINTDEVIYVTVDSLIRFNQIIYSNNVEIVYYEGGSYYDDYSRSWIYYPHRYYLVVEESPLKIYGYKIDVEVTNEPIYGYWGIVKNEPKIEWTNP